MMLSCAFPAYNDTAETGLQANKLTLCYMRLSDGFLLQIVALSLSIFIFLFRSSRRTLCSQVQHTFTPYSNSYVRDTP